MAAVPAASDNIDTKIPEILEPQPELSTEVKETTEQNPIDSTEASEEEHLTVFNDPSHFNIKHPLHNAWSFWYDSPAKRKNIKSWSQNLNHLVSVDSVEDFWGVFNNITKVSELANGSNYHLFRDGIKPEWEDPANQNGGKWVFQTKKAKHDVDNMWMFTLLACIGETFQHENELNGAIFSSRREFNRISLWTRSANNQEIALEIGKTFKEVLGGVEDKFEFTAHSDKAPKFNTPDGRLYC